MELNERRSRRQEEQDDPVPPPSATALSMEEMEFAAEIDELAADTLTEAKLYRIAGTRNLETVSSLELVVDTSRQTVEDLGNMVPCLRSLTLDGSAISSIRDLGTALKQLHTLSLNGSGLEELDGMSALPELRELHLRDNRLSELTGLCMHDTLQVTSATKRKLDLCSFPFAFSTPPHTKARPFFFWLIGEKRRTYTPACPFFVLPPPAFGWAAVLVRWSRCSI